MQDREYAARVDAVKQRAHGRWTEILGALGVDERILKRRNLPCPLCGGTDRFQYTDKFGEGNYHCRSCGPGGGFKLLQAMRGIDFNTALREVERCLGILPSVATARPTEPSAQRMKKLAQRIWSEAQPIKPGDEVDRYLSSRGLALPAYPKVLRYHPALGYYQKDASGKSRKVAEYPAILACIQGADGHAVTLHRTYLQDGAKLAVEDAKKVLSAGINGAAVRLFEATEELAISEGIEKSIAVHLATGKPVWAGLNAGNLEKLWIPDSVRKVCIYSDNDADGDFAGQAFAFALARRLKREEKRTGPREVRVFVPRQPGVDWSDVWLQRLNAVSARAA
ncbi:toprim domain-containing protein [Cupriavidus basilensis]|uniref:Toprim domain-containing protein n=1 Tax=Cupriavidus basilensis TaxID=68895 RepID=A0ABT6AI26_9BURK|nr:toprim domain-containing protein [Cupriavidus basilensis]MDF3831957.1 toprim domain-containing protein [Cupriavidus basilensis]